MKCSLALALVSVGLACSGAAAAQDLVIANARIITGTGQVIEHGAIVVHDGKIAAVSEGAAPKVRGAQTIDAKGMTAIAGFIDDHRHLIQARGPDAVAGFLKDKAPGKLMELLEAGFTTVQSGGDDNAGILELKKMVASGQIKGPRIIASGGVPTSRLPDEAAVRAAVDKVVKDGADSIAEVAYPDKAWPYNPTIQETKNLAAGIAEAKKLGVEFQVHTVSPQALMGAVRIGATKLVHSVHHEWVSAGEAKEVAAAGAIVSSTSGYGVPVFGVYNQDNKPTFRDGKPWPDSIIDGQGTGQEAGYKPVNLRTLYDNGVKVTYSTDTDYDAHAAFAHELRTLNLMFSPTDLIPILGTNSAEFLDLQGQIGTLEKGKDADIALLGGNPFDGYWNFLTAEVVIKGGAIMVDKRGQPDAGKPIARGF